jgi:uncharacterized protein (TIGR00661 family)
MKVLYAIQATGNGHISRACEMVPELKKHAQLDVFLSGSNSALSLPFEVKYRSKGFSFAYGKHGGLHYWKTLGNVRPVGWPSEALQLPWKAYDLIMNDFESISAWGARWKNVPVVSVSHQSALWSSAAPRPEKKDRIAEGILQWYAPASRHVGLHFKAYDTHIQTPIIRCGIREAHPHKKNHITVYLPAVSAQALWQVLRVFPGMRFEIFHPEVQHAFVRDTLHFHPTSQQAFQQSMISSSGVITGAGFETPAEALFLGKKLLVMPIRGQYEQACNAAALREMGIPVIHRWDINTVRDIRAFLDAPEPERMWFPEHLREVAQAALYGSY